MRHYGGPLLLGLKYLNTQLRAWAPEAQKSNLPGSEWLLPAAARTGQACKWVMEQVPATIMQPFKDSLAFTIYVADHDYEELFPLDEVESRAFRRQIKQPIAVSKRRNIKCMDSRRRC